MKSKSPQSKHLTLETHDHRTITWAQCVSQDLKSGGLFLRLRKVTRMCRKGKALGSLAPEGQHNALLLVYKQC